MYYFLHKLDKTNRSIDLKKGVLSMKRILIVLLLAAQLLAAASCGGDSGEKVPSGGSDRTEDTSAEETTSFYDSIDIPDFSGRASRYSRGQT